MLKNTVHHSNSTFDWAEYYFISFLTVDDPNNKSRSLQYEGTEKGSLRNSPCQDINQEPFEIQQCCRLFSKHFKNTNLKQVMSLMRHSLDLTNPSISHYYKKRKYNGTGYNLKSIKSLSKEWLFETEDEIMKLFPGKPNGDFLQQFG